MSSRPLLYLLDGHALAYRHYFAQINRPLTTSSGEPTSAVFGFARTLMDILEKDQPDYLAVAFDDGMSGRDALYSDYKSTREKMPDELERQLARIQQIVTAFNVPVLIVKDAEADDVMGTISVKAQAQGVASRIITGDRDLLQLLDEHTTVRLAIPQPGAPDELYDVAKFREKYGLEPIQLIDLKALEGDTSDNIPGVAGIGRKGATTLLQQFPTLEAIYDNLALIKEGVRKKLVEGRESAFLSKRLATIHRDLPLEFDKALCLAHDYDKKRVEAIYRELEFSSLLRHLDRLPNHGPAAGGSAQLPLFDMPAFGTAAAGAREPGEPVFPTITVQDEAALDAMVRVLKAAKTIAFDVESTAADEIRAELVGISLSADGETGYYIPVAHSEGTQLPLEVVINALRDPLTDPNIGKAAHNAVYDLCVLQRYGLDVTPITFDTMVGEWVRDPGSENLGLKRLAKYELGVDMTEIETLIGTGKKQITMDQVAIEAAAPYAAADAVATFKLVEAVRPKLLNTPEAPDPLWGTPNPPPLIDVLEQLEMPLVPVITAMEQTGVLLDQPELARLSRHLGERMAALEDEIYGLNGGYGKFNINSPKQLNDVLFGKLGLPTAGLRKTTQGYSVDSATLETLHGQHPIIGLIEEYREMSKLKSTYADALPALINPRTGRVHTSYHQTGASTGRMSSSNPNLQNIPIRTEIGREVRRAFIAPAGCALLSVDYSQIELRIMAHITQEPALLTAFEQGQDIHAATAAIVHNVPLEAVTREQRIFAKRVNFGVLYGMGAFRLARDSELTFAEAEAFIKTYFDRLPGVKTYLDKAKDLAYKRGYLTTLFGRRRAFPGLQHGNRNTRSQAEREAINMPIQGTAADIVKRAMIDLFGELRRRGAGARLILQVHDELVLEVPEAEVGATAALVVETMEAACKLDAPLRANAQVGPNWRDMTGVV